MTARPEDPPTPWATGLPLTGFTAAATVVVVVAFGSALAWVHPILAVLVLVVTAAGAAPTVLAWLRVPVLRWFGAGVAVGVPVGWLVLLVS